MAASESPRRCRGRKGERALSEIPRRRRKGTKLYSVSCPESENKHLQKKKIAVSQIKNRQSPGGSGDFLVIRAGAYDVGPRAS